MDTQSYNVDSTTMSWNINSTSDYPPRYDPNDTPTVNSTNPDYQPVSSSNNRQSWDKTNSVTETAADKVDATLKKGQQHAEDIITKSKRLLTQQWEQTRHSVVQLQRRIKEMTPKQATDVLYWQNPIQTGIIFAVLLSITITFMLLSSLAAISFWLLALLAVVGLYKLYNYFMATFLGRVQDDIFDSLLTSDIQISERQAQALANYIRANGTSVLKQARSLFLWNNLTNSITFGLVLFVFYYIGLSMNALTFALVGLVFLFTVPKVYHVYQVPIDNAARQGLDQINHLLAKVTNKTPAKPKKA